MQFTSFSFLAFFPVVVLLFYLIPKKLRRGWLLAASYYFYMGWNAKYVLLILLVTVVTYLFAIALENIDSQAHKKRLMLLAGCLAFSFGLLFLFKYVSFIYDTIVVLSGRQVTAQQLNILLPAGISFYTFQTVGYVIDVYRGDIRAEHNFVTYALFVSFFPQLVAGPIERSSHLIGQLARISKDSRWDFDRMTRGLLLMLWGFFMKMVIADRAAMLVDQVYDIYYMMGGAALLTGCVLFAIQLYCDFASYSTIAVGAAKVLGIELTANFEAPFFSRSVQELWRRWHVSLSAWFRDYLYIPLGGNRCSKLRRNINILVTFTLSGLWHGAGWHFVVWGMLQGGYIVIGDLLRPVKERVCTRFHVRTATCGYRFVQRMGTFMLFAVSMVFFRANSVRDAMFYFKRMITRFDVWTFFDGSIFHMGMDRQEMSVLFTGILLLIVVDACYARKRIFFDALLKSQCLAIQYMVVAVLLVMVVVFGVYGEGYDAAQFIYFQF